MSVEFLLAVFMTVISTATPLLLASTGELVVEKSGVLNLGVEGMMLTGAVIAAAVTLTTGSHALALGCAAFGGIAIALIFAVLTISLSASQVATGLALTIFGTGFSAMFGRPFTGQAVPLLYSPFLPELSAHPVLRVIFGHSPLVYFSLVMIIGVWWFLGRTRWGLIVRAVGENDLSAHSIGYSVARVRYLTVSFGGAMAGIAGACYPVMLLAQWSERITAGQGWIALSLVVFASWRPLRLLGGAYLFGLLLATQAYIKAGDSFLKVFPTELITALPYLAAIVALLLISLRQRGGVAPACLGRPFIPSG